MSIVKEQTMGNGVELAVPQPTQAAQPVQAPERREPRRQERTEEAEAGRTRRMIGRTAGIGGLLYVVGMIFLLQNFGLLRLENWWALFILMLAFGSVGTAWTLFRANGNQFSLAARAALVSGAILSLLSLIFLAGWSFALVWPLFLIVGGLSILGTLLLPRA